MTRKEAIEYLRKADASVYHEPKTKTAEALEMAIKALQEQIVWHPYPKEKPKADKDYNVTLRYSKCTVKANYDTEYDEWRGGNDFYVLNRCITAWAELPKPYKEGAENE